VSGYIPRQRIEQLAVEHWRRDKLRAGFDVEALVDRLGLGIIYEPIAPDRGQTVAAELLPDDGLIRLNQDLEHLLEGNLGFYRFTLAHELGHWDLHSTAVRTAAAPLFGERDHLVCRRLVFGRDDPPADTLGALEGQREHQANLFSSYLLAPTDVFIARYRETGCDGWRATYALAEHLGLSVQATIVRLTEEGLGHRDDAGVPRPGRRPSSGQQSLDW
jgi:IrrE N-terminal-like domain